MHSTIPKPPPLLHTAPQDPNNYAYIESELVFLGLVGLQDPPRPEVPGAIMEVSTFCF